MTSDEITLFHSPATGLDRLVVRRLRRGATGHWEIDRDVEAHVVEGVGPAEVAAYFGISETDARHMIEVARRDGRGEGVVEEAGGAFREIQEAEGRRAAAEATRVQAEGERRASEQLRGAAEELREASEASRRAAEEARRAAEVLRRLNEQSRAAAEEMRAAAEEARRAVREYRSTLKSPGSRPGGDA